MLYNDYSGNGPPPSSMACPCSTCVDEPYHNLRCHFCKVCYFKIEEDANEYNLISTDGLENFNCMPGSVVWLCPTCSHKSIADVNLQPEPKDDSVPDWFHKFYDTINERLSSFDSKLNSDISLLSINCQNLMEKVHITSEAVSKLLDKISLSDNATTIPLDTPSPIRKKSKTESLDSGNAIEPKNTSQTMHGKHQSFISKWKLPLPASDTSPMKSVIPTQQKPVDKFCIKLKRDRSKCEVPIANTLQSLAKDCKLKSYNYNPKGKYAINLLFPDVKQCESALDELNTSLNAVHDIDISGPAMVFPKRTYFVGLPEGMSALDLHESLCLNYRFLNLKSDNKFCMKIFEPKQCINNSDIYRSTVLLSDELYDYFMNRLNGHVSLGNYTRLHVFNCITRCSRCQSFKHSYDQCTANHPICANCGEDHYTNKCSQGNNLEKLYCVNCAMSTKFKDRCKGHAASDRLCHVYRDVTGQG